MDTLADSLMNSFGKVKNPDPKFIEVTEYRQNLEENLLSLERLHQRIIKRQEDFCEDLANFGGVLNLLSTEENLGKGFHKFGQVHERTTAALRELNDTLEFDFQSQMHDYLLYTQAIKLALKQRDIQQIEYEELSAALESKLADRESVIRPDQGSTAKSLLNSIKGNSDPAKLQESIDELQKAVNESSEAQKRVSTETLAEFVHFSNQKTQDFKLIFKEYALAQQKFAQKMLDQWQEVLPLLEEMKLD